MLAGIPPDREVGRAQQSRVSNMGRFGIDISQSDDQPE